MSDDWDPDTIVWQVDGYMIVFDGEGYFGFYEPCDNTFSTVGPFDEALRWCLQRLAERN